MFLTDREFWNKNYALGGKDYPNSFITRLDYELPELLHEFMESKRGGQIIEMGCGDSYWLAYWAKKYDFQVYGIDFSEERLNSAKYKLFKRGLDSNGLICCDFMDIPDGFKNKFDIVYSHGVIEHFEKPDEILAVFKEYLKLDGIMITTVPHLKSIWGKLQEKISRKIIDGTVCMDLEDLKTYHNQSGLNIIQSTYYRWLDLGMINFQPFPVLITKLIYGLILCLNVFINLCFRIYQPKFSDTFYSDMLVVSKKCREKRIVGYR
jgi:ubiquinone/menaquinone biosynthesis C-methylase UbiE